VSEVGSGVDSAGFSAVSDSGEISSGFSSDFGGRSVTAPKYRTGLVRGGKTGTLEKERPPWSKV
jgi:hypothetical protein